MKNFSQSSSLGKFGSTMFLFSGSHFCSEKVWHFRTENRKRTLKFSAPEFRFSHMAIERWTFQWTRRSTSRVYSKAMLIATINPEAGNPWNFFKAFAAQIERCWVGVDSRAASLCLCMRQWLDNKKQLWRSFVWFRVKKCAEIVQYQCLLFNSRRLEKKTLSKTQTRQGHLRKCDEKYFCAASRRTFFFLFFIKIFCLASVTA